MCETPVVLFTWWSRACFCMCCVVLLHWVSGLCRDARSVLLHVAALCCGCYCTQCVARVALLHNVLVAWAALVTADCGLNACVTADVLGACRLHRCGIHVSTFNTQHAPPTSAGHARAGEASGRVHNRALHCTTLLADPGARHSVSWTLHCDYCHKWVGLAIATASTALRVLSGGALSSDGLTSRWRACE